LGQSAAELTAVYDKESGRELGSVGFLFNAAADAATVMDAAKKENGRAKYYDRESKQVEDDHSIQVRLIVHHTDHVVTSTTQITRKK
jgi:hypothetical protein